MSEIISSVYELMENTGIQNGILFLDEINCVSETLTPIMLQFLQYKCSADTKSRLAGSLSLPEIHRNITALSGSLTLPHGTD